MQPDEPSDELPEQLPLWAEEPPEEAAALLGAIERLRMHLQFDWWDYANALRNTADASTVRSILQRLAFAMETTSFEQWQAVVLLHDLGKNSKAFQRAVLPLIPRPEELAELEQAVEVVSADPESRKLVSRIAERLPSRAQVAKLTPWAVFVMVSIDVLKIAPELNPNDIGVLTMILMVVLYLLPPRSGS